MTFIIRIPLLSFVYTSLLISATAIQQDVPRPLRKRVEYCDDVKYGRPTFDDCLLAWMVLPYYDDVRRQFVSVPVDAPIHEVGAPVQLPLIRGFQSCRIAITNPVAPSGGPTEDEGTWTDVRIAAQGVLQWCVAEGLKGGTDEATIEESKYLYMRPVLFSTVNTHRIRFPDIS
ncbi:MAG: hypothetical protein M1835_002254 [Candelina submexicana]|nr:MAG: hypothetical protein M1835_002254 [Candelina submexicana]